ncbi:mucin-5AC-like isoform X14 [Papilio machaon]|uniref:mucin-5AC-like isoform X14 n=1 Tax=Papilio machaon TaxID=76193 RepID=UPI001E664C27|nr:mucin-5AC-like isoform X14 [Papilio machaon]
MRAGVWSAAALLLLAAVTAALRTAQVEGVRNSRRLSNFDSRGSTSTEKIDDAQPTFRSRSYRRRDETSTPVARDITRSKSRNRAPEPLTSNAVTEQSPTDNGRNERFDSRRTNRIRSRPIESQNAVTTFPSRDSTVNNKARQSNRRSQYTTTTVSSLAPSSSVTSNFRRDVNRRAQTTTTEAVTILSSPTLDEFKSEITASSFDDFTRTVPKEEDITTVQFKKRSTTAKSVEVETQASTKAPRTRGRVSPKTNIKLDDMASSGATNILSISENNLIVEKSSEDAKKSRKLRYRTRLSETDTNLTGEGITTSNEIIKTSRKQLKQPESRTTTLAPTERKVQRNVERNSSKSSIVKSMRVVRRPVSRGNENGTTLPKVKTSDEIGDDDNYPASFKAIIQAKNASTQVSSPPSESLSVKATHTAINTNTKTSLPSNTSIESNNFTRLRSKLNTTENDVKNGDEKLSDSPLDSPKLKSEEYKLRGTYSSRPRKVKTENLKTTTTTSSPNAVKTSYKYTRKLRTTTSSPVDFKSSESPRKFKRFESGQSPQTASRPLYSRTKIGKNIDKPAETVTDDSSRNNLNTSVLNNSVKLPRTSYYSRLRNNVKNGITTTAESANTDINNPFKAAKKTENTAETPLIYTMLNKQTKAMSEETNSDTKGEFLLAVSSKESQENNVETDPVTNAEESENMPVINVFSTTQKYHANYKDQGLGNDRQKNEYVATSATPVIRNIQTRKYTRKIFKSKENVESSSVNPVSKSKERALRKYSDTFSKTTEASTNGITTDPEKPKSRFSSKYRASNLDKPFYKPTVPTVTTTTAWLKFFVTDRQLTKSIKEPKWFDGNDFNDDTTELISRQNATTMAFTHQSSELEVGEEILLGPDMNAISFTQTRSALSSADLRLSESLEKPSQVMNVEASNHSPSVTVSIFDALAEILTSTPRIQISTTTDVPQQTFTDSVVKQTLNSTKQIRTEKPNDGQGNTVFKFIPIDEITVPPQETNVLTLASTKAPSKSNNEKEVQIVTPISVMEINSPTPEIQTSLKNIDEPTTTVQPTVGTPNVITLADNNIQSTMITSTTNPITTVQPKIESTTSNLRTTTFNSIENSNTITTTVKNVITTFEPTTERYIPDLLTTLTTTSMPLVTTTDIPSTTESVPVPNNSIFTTTEMTKTATDDIQGNNNINQENANLLQMLQSILSTNTKSSSSQEIDQMKLLQALLLSAKDNVKDKQKSLQTTTVRTIQDEIRQFEEDTKFLKALLQATGRDPAELNIPNLNDIKPTLAVTTTMKPITTTTQAPAPTTTSVIKSTTSIAEDLKKIKEDTQLLQALLQATGQTVDTLNLPVISGITSNVRIASNPRTTSIESNPTTPMNVRPIYTTIQSTEKTTTQTNVPQTISTLPTLQEQQSTVKEDIGISTTYRPVQRRITTTTTPPEIYSTLSARRAPSLAQVTTEVPSTSTFSVEEDLAFLNNLKTVLNTNNNDDPEAALANRVIALAVERSLNELQTGTPKSSSPPNVVNSIRTTRPTTTTTTMTTTTVYIPPVSTQSTPSIEDDIKQFEEDTKLLQALLKATGQDPSKFNIPTLPSVNKPNKDNQPSVLASPKTTTKPFGVKIAVKDELKNVQDDAQLLQTLIKLKDAQETTTQRNKIAITGQSSDEALQKLIQKAKPTAMVSEATKSSVSLSTEYGNSNDALLAALLKEQGFGPTTASSLDEQVRLAALLNQVVVTPKARRTTTPPPPPPAPRRPILDGLAWLWQQWRDTAPGAGGAGAGAAGAGGSRTNSRRPAPAQAQAPASSPTAAATPAPSRVNWFGSGPFVGNADDRPASNRIPLEPPRAVAAEQSPGRGQLVSAAINVTRAFSQFLGAAIQGAAQTVQNVIRAGQKAATDVYTNGSG